jgi:hypothetical protein
VDSQIDAYSTLSEIRSSVERRQDLIAALVAAGLNAADVEVTLKALTAQLELYELNQPDPQRCSSAVF